MKEVRILVTTDVEDHTKKSETFHSMQIALEKALSLKGVNIIEKELVKIDQSPTYMDWFRFREEFNKFTSEKPPDKPDIIYIRATEKLPPPGMDIQHIIRSLKKNYIVITNAMCIRGPVSPHAFPGDSVIAVGRKGDKVHGSTLDFVIEPCKHVTRISSITEAENNEEENIKEVEEKKPLMGHKNNEDSKHTTGRSGSAEDEAEDIKVKGTGEQKSMPWEASLEAVGIAAVILLKAQSFSK